MYRMVYQEWIKLFNEDFVQIWQHERKELQKVSLLLYALQKEINNVQTKVETEVSNLKRQLKDKEDLERKKKSLSPKVLIKKSPKLYNKENVEDSNDESKLIYDMRLLNNQKERKSPDLFRDVDLNTQCSSSDVTVIDLSISDDDINKVIGSSPTIKRRRKRNKTFVNPPSFNAINEVAEKCVTPIATPDFFRPNFKMGGTKSDPDLSVIESTPEVNNKRSKTLCRGDFSKKKVKAGRTRDTTITQLFRRKPNINNLEEEPDSDETYFEDNTKSRMGITDILQYVNADEAHRNEDESLCQEMETSSQEIDQFSKGAIFDEDEMEAPAKVPKVPTIEPEPVVRGQARKQLHGWTCQQCKNFYGQMNLSPETLQKKMDQCSRHRYKHQPPNETIPGFWDLSIPPEKNE